MMLFYEIVNEGQLSDGVFISVGPWRPTKTGPQGCAATGYK